MAALDLPDDVSESPEADDLSDAEKALIDRRLAEMELYPEDELTPDQVDAALQERR